MSTKFDSVEAFQKHGYTFAGFFDALRSGFEVAYAKSQENGFDPDGPISEGSKARVEKVYQVLEEQYGSVDLKTLGPVAVVSAIGLFQQLNEVIRGLESFSNATPADFDKVRDQLAAAKASSLANIGNYGGAAN